MAAVLSRAASQPFFPSSTGGVCARSSPSASVSRSAGPTIYSDRNVSYESKASDSSIHLSSYQMRDENDPFVERQGRDSLTPQAVDQRSISRKSPLIVSRTSSWSTVIRASYDRPSPQAVHVEACDVLGVADYAAECGTPYVPDHERRATSSLTHLPLPFHEAGAEVFNGGASSQYRPGKDAAETAAPALERQQSRSWIGFLRRGHSSHKRKASAASQCTEPSDVESTVQTATATLPGHRRSSSQTSAYVLSAIYENRSGAAAESSGNAARRSVRSSLRRSWARSNESSSARPRVSDDGFHSHAVPGLDEEAWKRAMQRRRIIEELISSEESYIAEMRIFVNVRPQQASLTFRRLNGFGLIPCRCIFSYLSPFLRFRRTPENPSTITSSISWPSTRSCWESSTALCPTRSLTKLNLLGAGLKPITGINDSLVLALFPTMRSTG